MQPHHIIGAVLQQELILYCGKLIATQPDLFDGILVLRMSLFVRAMAMFQNYISPNSKSPLENLPPSKILTLLEQMLSMTVMGSKKLPAFTTFDNNNSETQKGRQRQTTHHTSKAVDKQIFSLQR